MLLVDCYNVLHVAMPPSLAGLDEAGLCRLLDTHPWARQFGRIIVVADGRPKPKRAAVSPVEGVSLRFSGRVKSADDVIIELIKEDSAPRSLTVVSSDREIQRAARARRATVLASEALMRELSKRSARRGEAEDKRTDVSEKLPTSQVDEWLNAFKADPQALGAAESPAEVIRRTRAEASRRAAEEAARPKKGAYRRYRKRPAPPVSPDPVIEKPPAPLPEKIELDETEQWLKEFGVSADLEADLQADLEAQAGMHVTPEPPTPAKPLKRGALSKPPLRAHGATRRSMEKIGESLDKLSDGDIEAWLRVFGMTPEEGEKR